MNEVTESASFTQTLGNGHVGEGAKGLVALGTISEVAGAHSQAVLSLQALQNYGQSDDSILKIAAQIGTPIKMKTPDGWLLAQVRSHRRSVIGDPDALVADIDFIGEAIEDQDTGVLKGFRRGITRFPLPGVAVYPATREDLDAVYSPPKAKSITIGRVYPTRDLPAKLNVDALLGKHFALVGSTGTGKSTATALILHRMCDAAPDGHIVMVDPHGEYAAAFKDSGTVFTADNLQLPYWLMNFAEHCEAFLTSSGDERQQDMDILARCLLAARSKNRLAATLGKITVNSPVPYLLSDLTTGLQDEAGKLDKATSSAPYLRIKQKIDELKADPRYQFMFSGMLVGDTMGRFITKIFRLPADGKPIAIIDVSGIPSDITATVVALLARLVFDFAVWGRDEEKRPVLFVCEEAHRYVPNERFNEDTAARQILSRIAKEGRKYGISLGLITQRPSDLSEAVLSQCGTIISMRLNNEQDQAFVRAAMPESARGFLEVIPGLRNRECVVSGEGVTMAMRVSFDNLEEARRPSSDDLSFMGLWAEPPKAPDLVERVVGRWRSQDK